MNESYILNDTPIASRLTEAQSYALELEPFACVKYRYSTDEKTIELSLTATFLKSPYAKVRRYLDDCIRHYMAKN